ncbi:hypothetical protein POSPLADRAFT_1168434 [Postia placenta MAD-698-R-SB12]|uniref:RRM Nup35-type domain-containing protein n=1 Tax=Postia placenta MAD-698-R-SB12 TaxID=670580 RepID=A0A1X6N763_9APHY|nr:hypothetical protein POSPLADRAFT_1168434 [Postia placenta MAD-698-R-SB12]OSX64243.1 hypothetical protein POSPLADRAFT_1168434 [Postia placenta MAD-698-R-SB12]
MSVAQSNSFQHGSQRHEEAPLVQTKAKLSHSLAGGASDFGMDSMFESSRPRQQLADEDAPPMNSINDIVNEVYSTPSRYSPKVRLTRVLAKRNLTSVLGLAPTAHSTATPLNIVVFGYPPDKYSVTVEYFRSIGETTEAVQNQDISNCFRIGYVNPAEAMRAVRKNGDVLNGSWMIGVKWADIAQAEAVLGPSIIRSLQSPEFSTFSPDTSLSAAASGGFPSSSRMDIDEPGGRSPPSTPTPTVGQPIRLAPSTAAFRKSGIAVDGMPQNVPASMLNALPSPGVVPSPSKGMLEQVSDLIFGW